MIRDVIERHGPSAQLGSLDFSSEESFEDAISQGIGKASETVHNIKGPWVKEQKVVVENGSISGYRVDLKVTSSSTEP